MTPPSDRLVLHADMDAFYASVEQRERPELLGKPVIVGAQSARGVVAAASYEARAYGVHSAMPGFMARRLCPNGIFLPGRMDLYARVSSDVRAVFENFTSDIEPLALDEAFLDITGTLHLYRSALDLGAALKRQVKAATGLVVSVGIGPSKLVAKLVCTLSKPDGLGYVPLPEVQQWLRPLPVRRLWGVGPTTEQRLLALGCNTLGAVMDAPDSVLRLAVGNRAQEFRRRACGQDDSPVQSDRAAKSIGEENTFASDVVDDAVIATAIAAHADAVARRLRRGGYHARTVVLKIKLGVKRGYGSESSYPIITRSKTLTTPTDDGKCLRDAARLLWQAAGVHEPVRLLGVTASNLVELGDTRQLDLFEHTRRRPVGETVDAIVAKFGKGAIRTAATAPEKMSISVSKRPDRSLPAAIRVDSEDDSDG